MPTLSKIGCQTRHEEGLIRFRQELDKKQYSIHSYLDRGAVFNLNYVISTQSKGKLYTSTLNWANELNLIESLNT